MADFPHVGSSGPFALLAGCNLTLRRTCEQYRGHTVVDARPLRRAFHFPHAKESEELCGSTRLSHLLVGDLAVGALLPDVPHVVDVCAVAFLVVGDLADDGLE